MHHLFNSPTSKSKRQHLRSGSTAPEQKLWSKLRGKQVLGQKFRRQFGVGNFILDFYSPQLKLAIEIDGDSHAGEAAERYDEKRAKYLADVGIQCLRFTNHEVMQNLGGVLAALMQFIEENSTPPHLPWEKGRD
ncbi:MAG: endonuclease domain-containing protein [Candidatus Liptonbacteria bacterium]|nr:endonuclease domain-containing protein [Candidatus Liptonbacteria bacterium]